MKSLSFISGLLITMGTAGGLDSNVTNFAAAIVLSIVGLALMFYGSSEKA